MWTPVCIDSTKADPPSTRIELSLFSVLATQDMENQRILVSFSYLDFT